MIRGARKQEVGFVLSVQMFVDQDTQETVSMTCNAPLGCTSEQLAGHLATMREAGWRERLAANDRILKRGETIKASRDKRIAEAKAEGKPLDDDAIEEEDAAINTALLKQQVERDADLAATNRGPTYACRLWV